MKQVIIVRKDLTMRKGKLAAQVAHASVESIIDRENDNNEYWDDNIKAWLMDGMSKIVVGCNSEDELFQLAGKAKEEGLQVSIIKDAGNTEFHGVPTYTCAAIGPDEDHKVDKITSHLKLL